MSTRIKVLGMTVVMVFATCAVASSASAAKFDGPTGRAFITIDPTKAPAFGFNGGNVKCTEIKAAPITSIEGEVESFEIEPIYEGCTAFGQKSTIDMNGCKYKFTASSTTAGGMSITCPKEKEIVITVGDPTVVCTISIKAQTPSTPSVDYTLETIEGEADFTETSTVGGITYTSSNKAICGESGANGTYTGAVKVTGFKERIERIEGGGLHRSSQRTDKLR